MRHIGSVQRPHDGVQRRPCRQRQHAELCQQSPEPVGRDVRQVQKQRQCQRHQRDDQRRTAAHPGGVQQKPDFSGREQASGQIVGHLKPGEAVQRLGTIHQERQQLPVAPRPASGPAGHALQRAGLTLKPGHVVGKARPGDGALDQIVGQDRVVWQTPLQRVSKRRHVHDALAAEYAPTGQIPVQVTGAGGISAHARVRPEQRVKGRGVTLHGVVHVGLNHGEPIARPCHRTHQLANGIGTDDRLRIQRHHVFELSLAQAHGGFLGDELGLPAGEQRVQRHQRAAFALLRLKYAVSLVEHALAPQYVPAVAARALPNIRQHPLGGFHHVVIFWKVLLIRLRKVRQQQVFDVFIRAQRAVGLQLGQPLLQLLHAGHPRRNGHQRAHVAGNGIQLHLQQRSGGDKAGGDAVEDIPPHPPAHRQQQQREDQPAPSVGE